MKTYWNGEETPCRRVIVEVGPSEVDTWWCAKLVGHIRQAVEVNYSTGTFYLDDEDGSGWRKVTTGMGGPRWNHKSLPVAHVIRDIS